MRVWKLIGLAGVAGVATLATVAVVKRRRAWTELTPEEIRDQLHSRLAEAS